MRDPSALIGYSTLPLLLTLLVSVPVTRMGGSGRRASTVEATLPLSGFRVDSTVAEDDRATGIGGILIERHLGGSLPQRDVGLAVLIATVPDPTESSLDWAYDSYLQAIRRALEASEWVIDRSWFPSSRDSVTLSVGSATVRVPAGDAQPSAMLFRHSRLDSLMLVYLVGELPTSGVHGTALEVALDERSRLLRHVSATGDTLGAEPGGRHTIRVLGPSFSGSAESLRHVLDAWAERVREGGGPGFHFKMATGAATASTTRARLEGPGRADESQAAIHSFSATVHSNRMYMEILERDVLPAMGLRKDQVAFLVEGNTAYGRSLALSGYLSVAFPTNIAALRQEYALNPTDEPERAVADPIARRGPRLPISLSTRPRPRENPPARSPLTPAALDLVLGEIARTLQTYDVKAIGIVATDVRDKLFLASVVKQRLRDVQLFTFESNVLLLRPDFGRFLRGALVLSTYPLIAESQAWTGDVESFLPFSHDGAQGVYNAALLLLGRGDHLVDYRPPGRVAGPNREASSPPVWITTVGRDSFLPVRAIGVDDPYISIARGSAPMSEGHVHRPGRLFLSVALIALLVILVPQILFPGRHVRREEEGPKPSTEADGEEDAHVNGPGLETLPRTTLWIAVLAVLAPFIRVSMITNTDGNLWQRVWPEALTLVMCVAILVALGVQIRGLTRRWRDMEAWEGGVPVNDGTVGGSAEVAPTDADSASVEGGPVEPDGAPGVGAGTEDETRPTIADRFRAAVLGVLEWLREGRNVPVRIGHQLVPLLAIVLGLLALLYVAHIWYVSRVDPNAFLLYRFRVLRLDGGASPLLPLLLASVALGVSHAWYVSRSKLLSEVCSLERVRGVHPDQNAAWSGPFEKASSAIRAIRAEFTAVIPPGWIGLASLVLMSVAALALPALLGFHTLEMVTFPAWRSWTPADLILAWSLLAGLFTVFGATLHLLRSWRALSDGLAAVAETPLLPAFSRVPDRIRALGRLHLFDPPSEDRGESVGRMSLIQAHPWLAARPRSREGPAGAKPSPGFHETVARLFGELLDEWNRNPGSIQLDSSTEQRSDGQNDLRKAEVAAAVEVVRYLDWALRNLRRLSVLLLFAIVITTALLVSYPTPVRGVTTVLFVGLMMFSLGGVLMMMAQLSQDEVLSRIRGTTPGKISWNRVSMFGVIVFVSLPILGVLGAEVPAVGRVVFAWINPLLRVLTGL